MTTIFINPNWGVADLRRELGKHIQAQQAQYEQNRNLQRLVGEKQKEIDKQLAEITPLKNDIRALTTALRRAEARVAPAPSPMVQRYELEQTIRRLRKIQRVAKKALAEMGLGE